MNIFFVYGLYRKYAKKPFYIGKGDRPQQHITHAQQDPDYGRAISESTTARWADPSYKAKVSASIREGQQKRTPQERSDAIRKGWETRKKKGK